MAKTGILERTSIPWTTKQICKMMDNGSLVFDNAVQRRLVWDKGRDSLLIDSIVRGYPVPPINLIKTNLTVITPKGEVTVFDGLDGKQRSHAIHSFRNNEFALVGLDPMPWGGSEIDLNGLTYEQLPEDIRQTIDDFTITVYKFENATDEDVVEIMRRLNNGKPLSAIDFTRIRAKDLKGISELGKHDLFQACLSDKARSARQEEDIIVKVWSQLQDPHASLDNKDVKHYYEELEITDEVRTRLTAIFDRMLAVHDKLVSVESKKAARRMITKTHLITLSYFFDKFIEKNFTDDEILRFVDQIYGSEGKPTDMDSYNEACQNGSNHAPNVAARHDAIKEQYDWFVAED